MIRSSRAAWNALWRDPAEPENDGTSPSRLVAAQRARQLESAQERPLVDAGRGGLEGDEHEEELRGLALRRAAEDHAPRLLAVTMGGATVCPGAVLLRVPVRKVE